MCMTRSWLLWVPSQVARSATRFHSAHLSSTNTPLFCPFWLSWESDTAKMATAGSFPLSFTAALEKTTGDVTSPYFTPSMTKTHLH